MRRKLQWGFASDWSHEVTVTPAGNDRPAEAVAVGSILQRDENTLLHKKPLKRAISYTVDWVGKNGINGSNYFKGTKLDYLLLENVGIIRKATVTASF